jgi:LytS/YehU family sensor histidine kinase
MEGLDKKWITTNNTSVRFSNLKPGKYCFYIQVSDASNYWFPPIKLLEVNIRKNFYQTNFFKISLFLVVLLWIAIVFYLIIRNKKRELKAREDLLLTEQKALRSQMNPHFMFNSMNALQAYILNNDAKKAASFVSLFSRLMRKVFDNSQSNVVILAQELDALESYLSLENTRFPGKFEYQIQVDPNIDVELIKIPPMLLQPLLENAIWHGLSPKQSKGKLWLRFIHKNESVMVIEVEDNGIGREKAMEISAKRIGHTSSGMKNISERLELLAKLLGKPTTIEVTDLKDDPDGPAGTLVSITLPLIT